MNFSKDHNEIEDALETFFGFKPVPPEERRKKINAVFSSVASRYNLMNDAMSFGLHRSWKNHLIDIIRPRDGAHILDMAAGTGDITLKYLKKSAASGFKAHVTLCDYNREMLGVAEKRLIESGFIDNTEIVNADAAKLPFEDNRFDSYVISYGLRNVTFIEEALREAYRVLKPGSNFVCLEFSKVRDPLLSKFYKAYRFEIIPKLGKCIAKDEASYQYLSESIEQFYDQETLKKMLESVGFSQVSYQNILGGISAVHQAIKV